MHVHYWPSLPIQAFTHGPWALLSSKGLIFWTVRGGFWTPPAIADWLWLVEPQLKSGKDWRCRVGSGAILFFALAYSDTVRWGVSEMKRNTMYNSKTYYWVGSEVNNCTVWDSNPNLWMWAEACNIHVVSSLVSFYFRSISSLVVATNVEHVPIQFSTSGVSVHDSLIQLHSYSASPFMVYGKSPEVV